MSVLINIEMPVSCRVCDLSQPDGVGWICPVVTGKPVVDNRIKTRHPRCPLVEIPAHGRLIDADALISNLEFTMKNCSIKGHTAQRYREMIVELSIAPTVIEPEEAEA